MSYIRMPPHGGHNLDAPPATGKALHDESAGLPISSARVRLTKWSTDCLGNDCLPTAQAAGRQNFFLAIKGAGRR